MQTCDFENLTPFERFQFEKYGDILPVNIEDTVIENGSLEQERFATWSALMYDRQLLEHEENF